MHHYRYTQIHAVTQTNCWVNEFKQPDINTWNTTLLALSSSIECYTFAFCCSNTNPHDLETNRQSDQTIGTCHGGYLIRLISFDHPLSGSSHVNLSLRWKAPTTSCDASLSPCDVPLESCDKLGWNVSNILWQSLNYSIVAAVTTFSTEIATIWLAVITSSAILPIISIHAVQIFITHTDTCY